jgi:nucleoside-diphosphate-sugar epimerase
MFKSKKVLITGGIGFLGSNLAAQLVRDGAKVTVIDSLIPEYGGNLWNIEPIKDEIDVNISDVRDVHAMKHLVRGFDYLFNLAGQTSHLDSMNDPFTDLDINAKSQLSILEACREHNREIKIVFAGTRQVYGRPRYLPVDENHPTSPVDINGINKLSGEWFHLLYHYVYGMRASILRLTNTYGPRMRVKDARQTFLGVWIKQLLRHEKILVYGDGKQIRDFNYVDDAVDALLLAATSPAADGQVFNLGAPDYLSLESVAQLMIELEPGTNYERIPFPPERKQIDVGDYYGDFRKIRKTLGWNPKVTLRAGLEQTLDYYREYLGHYL